MRQIGDYIWFQNDFAPERAVSIGKIVEIRPTAVVVVELCGDGKEIWLTGRAVTSPVATPEEIMKWVLER